MCLWCMRMVSIYNGAQGNPGGDESFAEGQYCIYTERSGSADMDFPEVVDGWMWMDVHFGSWVCRSPFYCPNPPRKLRH